MKTEHERQEGETEQQYRARVEAAFKAGKRVECRHRDDSAPWGFVRNPSWIWSDVNYRIAPGQQEKEPAKPFVGLDMASGPDRTVYAEIPAKQEPAKAREWWVVFQGNVCVGISPMHPEAWQRRETGEAIKVREVLPGDREGSCCRETKKILREKAETLLAQRDKAMQDVLTIREKRLDALNRLSDALRDAETIRGERDAAIQARDNALSAVRDMRAEFDKVTAERDALLVTRSNQYATLRMHLEAFNSVNAELAEVKAERDEYRNDLLESERRRDKMRTELNQAEELEFYRQEEIKRLCTELNQTSADRDSFLRERDRVHELHGKAVLDLISAQSRIIALQDELAASKNETATLAAKLTEATR